jgi:hypothetical protein
MNERLFHKASDSECAVTHITHILFRSWSGSVHYQMTDSLGPYHCILTYRYLQNSQNYWIFGLLPSSGILENRKHDVSKAGSVNIFR